ncbi:MAG: acyl--CoA ligase [Candidatus Aminicenantes bacterium]|nr:acyl--CoA ligase [Candidatus Aminicenantes bacterium]
MNLPLLDTYWQYVEYWGEKKPDFPSMRDDKRIVTAREFQEKTDRLAKAFMKLGVVKGDRVATILPQGIDYILVMVAANKAGAILVPLDVKFRIAEIKRFLTHTAPKILVALPRNEEFDFAKALASFEAECDDMQLVWTGGDTECDTSLDGLTALPLDLDEKLKERKKAQDKEDGALIIFTGGTTGVPKAALLSNRNATHMSYYEIKHIFYANGLTGQIKMPVFLPPSHIGGTVEVIGMGIVGGYEMIMMENWSPSGYLELLQKERVQWAAGVPTMFAIMLSLPDLNQYDLTSLRLSFMSGEKVSLELLEGVRARFSDIVISGYGATEVGAETNLTSKDDALSEIAKGYVGRAIENVQIKIIDDEEISLPEGEIGEIAIKGPFAIKSYFGMPEENKSGFTSDGWVKTGDLGYLTENGKLYICGRKKHIIRVGSYTVLPSEIEEVVITLPEVGLAAAIGVPDKLYGEEIWLFIVPEAGWTIDENRISEHCRNKLAKFKVPKKVFIRNDIPLTRIGKADRIALREQILNSLKGG